MIRPPRRSTLFPSRRSSDLDEWSKPVGVDLKPHLVSNAKNVIAIEAENTTTNPNPAGLFLSGKIAHRNKESGNPAVQRSEEHTSELQSQSNLVCRLLLEKHH